MHQLVAKIDEINFLSLKNPAGGGIKLFPIFTRENKNNFNYVKMNYVCFS